MSLSEVNWTTHLGGTSRLTPDITFRVVPEEDEGEGETLQQDEPKVVGTPMKTQKKNWDEDLLNDWNKTYDLKPFFSFSTFFSWFSWLFADQSMERVTEVHN